jgi:hypothetical protein
MGLDKIIVETVPAMVVDAIKNLGCLGRLKQDCCMIFLLILSPTAHGLVIQ